MANPERVSLERQRFRFAMSEFEREVAALEKNGLEDDVDEDSIAQAIEELQDLIDDGTA